MTIELGSVLTRMDLQEELQIFARSSLEQVFSSVLENHLKDKFKIIARQVPEPTSPTSPKSAFEWCFSGADRQVYGLDRQCSGSDHQFYGPDRQDDEEILQTTPLSVTEGHSSRIVLASPVPCRIELPMDDAFSNMLLIKPDDLSRMPSWQGKLQAVIEHALFEKIVALLVVLNALALGYDANYMALNGIGMPSPLSRFTEVFFCVIFAVELSLRLTAFGKRFFTMPGWKWNCFDAALVSAQVGEQMLICLLNNKRDVNLGLVRLCRLLRVVRIARLLRTFHLFDELRAIIDSISSSIVSLSWSMVLLVVLMYVASLVFLESIAGAGKTGHDSELSYWFASLSRTILTMFECVVGGVSWDEVVSPIMAEVNPLLGAAFCVYIAGCLFAIMNLVTGVFVQNAITCLREDKNEVMAERITELFFEDAPGGFESIDDEVTWEIFEQKLEKEKMKDYFKELNVEISEAQDLFEFMDVDGSGSLSPHEIVRAILRLRGPARSLDLAMMMREVSATHRQVHRLEEEVRLLPFSVSAAKHAE